jgi:hypothetical protein
VRPLPASGHEEVVFAESAPAEGVEDFLDLATQVRPDPDSAVLEFAEEGFGNRGAEEHVDREFGDVAGEDLGRLRIEDKFPAAHLTPASARDHQQPSGGVEDR